MQSRLPQFVAVLESPGYYHLQFFEFLSLRLGHVEVLSWKTIGQYRKYTAAYFNATADQTWAPPPDRVNVITGWKAIYSLVLSLLFRPNIVCFVHGHSHLLGALTLLFASFRCVPVILRTENRPRKRSWISEFWTRLCLSRAASIAYIGEANLTYYKERGATAKQLRFLGYSVRKDLLFNFKQKTALLSEKLQEWRDNLAPDTIVIGACGAITARKNHSVIIKAIASATVKKRLAFLLVGDGPLRMGLESLAKELTIRPQFFCTGFLSPDCVGAAYIKMDAFVLPSLYETWGLVLNEAMHFGLAVAVSREVGSAPDLVQEGRNGFLFDAHDSSALASIFEHWVANADKLKSMGLVSLEIIERFTTEATAARFISILEDTLQCNR